SATLFRAGEELQVVVSGRWFYARNPLLANFPRTTKRAPAGCAASTSGRLRAGTWTYLSKQLPMLRYLPRALKTLDGNRCIVPAEVSVNRGFTSMPMDVFLDFEGLSRIR